LADQNEAPPDDGRDMYVDGKPPAAVPYDRFLQAVTKKNEERQRFTDAQATLQARDAELAAERARAAELEAKHADLNERFGLHRVGLVDDEATVVARALYQAQPEDKRAPSLVEWITGMRDKPDAIPRALAGYLGGPAPAAPAAPPRAADPAQAQPAAVPAAQPAAAQGPAVQVAAATRLPPPQVQAAPAAGGPTAEQLRAAREAAAKSGDWSAFNALVSKVRVGRPG
jgi:hypothetical protein